ncbi:glycosyltransferase family 2 protein [Colwellia polaris]|jgi:glycosyltransferase involved in cell wall biosynthesis|uniref:glycosyltransferase family 2 protein n=1 Tax=Colwellia polaris TaxID=326537 RepID=UPI000A172755|nr:glycosyltransferase [Colwellia polaris]
MSQALVSVVIPFYKGEQYLEKTIDSVLQQSYNNFELLIINDGSPNAESSFFAKLCQKDNRITVLHKNNGGVACARQFGIAKAKGEFIAFCDQDDLWLPEKIAKQIPLFNNPEVGLVYCGAIEDHITEGRKVELPFFNSYRGNIYSSLIHKNEIVSCTAVARRSLLIDSQVFDADIELMGVDDWLAWLKMSLVCKVDFVKEYLAIHVFHGENYSSNEEKMYQAELVCLAKIKPIAQEKTLSGEVNYKQVEANIHLRYAEAFIFNGDFTVGADALLEAASALSSVKVKCKGFLFKYTPNAFLLLAQSLKRRVFS